MTHRLLLPLASALALAACADSPDGDDGVLAPPPPGRGVQFTMTHHLAPGVEGEWCRFVRAPDTGLWVERDEVRFTAGSHHFLLFETSYDQIPTQTDDGRPVDTSGVFDCSTGATDGWSVTKLVGGSQNGSGDSMLAFPDGVAMAVRPGAVLLMNAHYLNASDGPLDPEVRINLWSRPRSEVTTEGDLLFLYNPVIKVPAQGDGRARWRCPVHADLTIANLQSHMHRRGVGFQAALVGGATLYENDHWQDVPVARFDPGLVVRAGSVIDYHCDYHNPEDRTVYQGARSTDEMCMLIGSYYPADPRTAHCLDADGGSGGEWVGNGTATCAETLGCVQAALGGGFDLHALTDCFDAASPAVAHESSAMMNCFINRGDPSACQAEIAACQAR